MPVEKEEQLKGLPIAVEPASISKCGMSLAKFAKRRITNQWYELSKQGQVIGAPTDFDFFKESEGKELVMTLGTKEKEDVSV